MNATVIIYALAAFGTLSLIGAMLVAYWLLKAPIGYQDQDGFHYGEKKK